MSEQSDRELLDRIAWIAVDSADRWYPPDETAEECIEAHDLDEGTAQHERGYHAGAFLMLEEVADMIHTRDDVFERARRYAEQTEGDIPTDWDVEEHWREQKPFGPIEIEDE